jgi:diguanylate cyclase (GGDEF)-like protein
MITETANRRILVVDDNEAIHADFRSVLLPREDAGELDALSAAIFSAEQRARLPALRYEIDSAYQGEEALQLVKAAQEAGRPYALAFVDVRMPPGWDGIQTIRELRKVDPNLQVAICSAYSDYSWQSILDVLGSSDWLLILKKPFDVVEVQQLACALTEKWSLGKRASLRTDELEQKVQEHAGQLTEANAKLTEQVRSLAEVNTQLAQEMEARQQADNRMLHIALHDALTDLPNRMLLMERIASCIERGKRSEKRQFAVLYCDLDNFKIINDSLGHRVGDQLLVQVAKTLNQALRTSSTEKRPSSDTVARLGGDEFVILLDDVPDEQYAIVIAERVKDALAHPILVEHNKLVLGASVGVAVSTGEYTDAIDLLRDADTALYHAKDRGKGCVALFDQEMRARATARMDLEQDLRRAIELKQFVVFYQPIVLLETEQVVSVEALVRWLHPVHGLLLPEAFIPVAEETGLIETMGEIVLEVAIEQVAYWRRTLPGMEDLKLNVNLSPRQLAHKNVIACIDNCLERWQMEPSALKLEITESAMIKDMPKTVAILNELVRRGIEIHLDDFGTGYSSLSVLHALPFSTVKLDKTFISNLSDELESPTAVRAIVMLAQHEGIRIVAEGIESYDQLAHLRQLDCEYGQGFYFSRPLPPTGAQVYLSESVTRATSRTATAESGRPVPAMIAAE